MLRFPGRAAAVAVVAVSTFWAQPPLTTIQDVLYKADGTRFNGVAAITWKSFEASDTSNITTQAISTRIVDGNLRVQLVPGTTATPVAYYSVKYNSDGKVQFEETWAVPPSSRPLRLRDVRIAAPQVVDPGTSTIQETDVVGLTADLAARAIKGPGYAPGRAAFINISGELEAVIGSPTDCVRVDGTSGPCGAPPFAFVDGEVPAGAMDGVNAIFTLSSDPNPPSSLALFRNGVLQKPGLDYTASARTIQFLSASVPQPGDTLMAAYRNDASGGSASASTGGALISGPLVICAAAGGSTSQSGSASLGTCVIPAGLLKPGDRVEARFDYGHEGTTPGTGIEVRWGNTVVLLRTADAGDAALSGRAEFVAHAGGAQWSAQSWGSALPFAASAGSAGEPAAEAVTIDFRGSLPQAGTDTLTLRNLTVVHYPAQ